MLVLGTLFVIGALVGIVVGIRCGGPLPGGQRLPALVAPQPRPQVQEDVEVARGDRSIRETPTDPR